MANVTLPKSLDEVIAAGVEALGEILDDKHLVVFCWLCQNGCTNADAYALVINETTYQEQLARYQAHLARIAATARAWEQASAHLRERGRRSSYRCWSCGTKFQAFDKDPHICPNCGTDLDAA